MAFLSKVRGGGLVNPRSHVRASPLISQAGLGHGGGGGASVGVLSVAGRTDDVVLTAADIGAGSFPGDVVFTTASTGATQSAADTSTRLATTAFVTTADALKANLASPTLTGTPSFPSGTTGTTQSAVDGSTKLATTAYVDTADALKVNLASATLTGTPSFPTGTTAATQTAADSTTKLATTAFVTAADNLKANKASPTFTGTVTTPAAAAATDLARYSQIPSPGTVGGIVKTVFRTSDSATISSNATLVNTRDDTLKWTVGTNDRWLFQGFLTFTAADSSGAATTADLFLGWSVPASATMQWGASGGATSSFGGYMTGPVGTTPVALRTQSNTLSEGAGAVTFGVSIYGYYTGGGVGGTVVLEWAQNTSNAATLQINKNSILLLWMIA